MAFIEARRPQTDVGLFTELISPLKGDAREIMINSLLIYDSANPGRVITAICSQISSLGVSSPYQHFHEGEDPKKWWKSLERFCSYLAGIHVGRDRLAIALAYFRDGLYLSDESDIMESVRQFGLLGLLLDEDFDE